MLEITQKSEDMCQGEPVKTYEYLNEAFHDLKSSLTWLFALAYIFIFAGNNCIMVMKHYMLVLLHESRTVGSSLRVLRKLLLDKIDNNVLVYLGWKEKKSVMALWSGAWAFCFIVV